MYSMVLMAAMLPSGDTASFGKRGGCNGMVAGSCHGGGMLGHHNRGNSCNGGGFLGHHNRGNSCNGGGFLGGKHHRGGCSGAAASSCGCCGTAPVQPSCGCTGTVITTPPPPVVMPKPVPTPVKPKTTD